MQTNLISDELLDAAAEVFKRPGVIEAFCQELKNNSAPERRVLTVEEATWLLLLLRWYGVPDHVVDAMAYRFNRVGADGTLLLDQTVMHQLGIAGAKRRRKSEQFYRSAAIAAEHFHYQRTDTGWVAKGISQTKLAREVGVSPATIREWRKDPEWFFGFLSLIAARLM